MAEDVTGRSGELVGRLLAVVDSPGPQLRAVATTLLIKSVDAPDDEMAMIEAMVGSDTAGAMIDPVAAAEAGLRLSGLLHHHLHRLAEVHGEAEVVTAMRDHVVGQVRRWAGRAVDDADNRRRAERLLAWADRPHELEAAQRRGLFVGMDADEFRRLADTQVRGPVTPETVTGLWAAVEVWLAEVDTQVGDDVLARWRLGA